MRASTTTSQLLQKENCCNMQGQRLPTLQGKLVKSRNQCYLIGEEPDLRRGKRLPVARRHQMCHLCHRQPPPSLHLVWPLHLEPAQWFRHQCHQHHHWRFRQHPRHCLVVQSYRLQALVLPRPSQHHHYH